MNLQEIQGRLRIYQNQVRKSWKTLLFYACIGAVLLAIWAYIKPVSFAAKASFHPVNTEGYSLGNLTDPLSLILGGAGASGGAETAQMMEVLQSRHLSELLTSDSINYQGQKRLMADLVLAAVPPNYSPSAAFRAMMSIFKEKKAPTAKRKVIKAGQVLRQLLVIKTNDNGFLEMDMSFYDAPLLQLVCEMYIEKLSAYYRAQQTEKAQLNLAYFSHRSDSIRAEIDKVNRSLARLIDKSGFSVSAQTEIKRKELIITQEFLAEMYKPVLFSLEQAHSQLQQATPVIQVLDHPLPPFAIQKASPFIYALVGFILGGLLAAMYLLRKGLSRDFLHVIRESLKEEKEGSQS